ncbi:MAG: SIS domain-containing protein [Solirubrobacterales bacterium]|nr:SIS domain-containing protein [Solirubrobacterales bacterium]
MSALRPASARELVALGLEQRRQAGERYFAQRADELARLCHRMAERFARGGRLIAIGVSPAARSDVRHVAVEFVHPVIVGKRALPAFGLTGESARLERELALEATAQDIVIAFGEPDEGSALPGALRVARERGCETIAFAALGAAFELDPPARDPFVRQELVETAYHVLWELVHVFFEHRGLLAGRTERRSHDAGASSFLYPFLAEREDDLDAVLADVRESVLLKWREVAELRAAMIESSEPALVEAAGALRESLGQGGRLLALGNGGSATDAMDVVADFATSGESRGGAEGSSGGAEGSSGEAEGSSGGPEGASGGPEGASGRAGWEPRPALDLTADSAILTAIANDIGVEAIFARQVIAYGRPGDVVIALSTSGNSLSVLDALGQARRDGLGTIAFVGYDGGRVAAEGLADHVIVAPSQHIPRIQEAQATGYHLLRELVELA